MGTLHIGPMQLDEVAALSVLVTRAFAGTPEAFSFKEIRSVPACRIPRRNAGEASRLSADATVGKQSGSACRCMRDHCTYLGAVTGAKAGDAAAVQKLRGGALAGPTGESGPGGAPSTLR